MSIQIVKHLADSFSRLAMNRISPHFKAHPTGERISVHKTGAMVSLAIALATPALAGDSQWQIVAPKADTTREPWLNQQQRRLMPGAAEPFVLDDAPAESPKDSPKAPVDQSNQSQSSDDTDAAPDMQIAWDEWHKRVGAAVFSRFQMMASTAFPRSRPMSAVAAYTVTRNGQIMNVRLTEKNFNPIYNAIVLTAIQQLNGNIETLKFPEGSRRMTMDKVGTFIHNNETDPIRRIRDSPPDPEVIRQRHASMDQNAKDTKWEVVAPKPSK